MALGHSKKVSRVSGLGFSRQRVREDGASDVA